MSIEFSALVYLENEYIQFDIRNIFYLNLSIFKYVYDIKIIFFKEIN